MGKINMMFLWILTLIITIGQWFVVNNAFLAIVATISSVTFLLRPLGTRAKWYKMVQGEFIFYFLIYMLSLFFKDFSILRFLLFLVIRAIQILIVWYDDTFYVYYEVKEEKEV
jgi:hypothetical protein